MRHSPTAYKYFRSTAKGLHENARKYGTQSLTENSVSVQACNAFGLKLVQRATFFQNPSVPRSVKRNVHTQPGEWVLYLPANEKVCIFVGDNPTLLARLAAAHMNQTTK